MTDERQRRARDWRSPREWRSLARRLPPFCVVAAARHLAVFLATRADPGLRVKEGVAVPLFRWPPTLDGRRHVVERERRAAVSRDLALGVRGFFEDSVVHKKRELGE